METLLLSTLQISQFRNLEPLDLAFSKRFNVISGQNGSGKTNLLEAIYFFSALRSFRTVFRKEIMRENETFACISGVFGGAAAGMTLEIQLGADSRKIKKDNKELTVLSDHFYNLPMVLFHPANMALIQAGPKDRRRFMDRALFQADPAYPTLISDYNRALSNRNRLLKSKQIAPSLLMPYDQQLAQLGGRIISARHRFIEKAKEIFVRSLSGICDGIEGEMIYKPNAPFDAENYLELLQRSRSRDFDRGFTGRGPHADDLELLINGRSARRFASQGQQRMAVLSMKIAEVKTLSEVTGRVPILLLDDISSELDRARNQAFFQFLDDEGGQVFITTTHLDHVRLSNARSDFLIDSGKVTIL